MKLFVFSRFCLRTQWRGMLGYGTMVKHKKTGAAGELKRPCCLFHLSKLFYILNPLCYMAGFDPNADRPVKVWIWQFTIVI